MDLLLLNKQRNKISLISILCTLVFVSFYVVSIILFTPILPLTPLLGGIILLVSDTVARIVLSPIELPVGVITSLLGSPFFISLIFSKQKEF